MGKRARAGPVLQPESVKAVQRLPVAAVTSTIVPCAICGGVRTRRLYTKTGFDIARCVRCGLVYANPRAPREVIQGRYSGEYFWQEYLPALGVFEGKYDLSRFDARYAPL